MVPKGILRYTVLRYILYKNVFCLLFKTERPSKLLVILSAKYLFSEEKFFVDDSLRNNRTHFIYHSNNKSLFKLQSTTTKLQKKRWFVWFVLLDNFNITFLFFSHYKNLNIQSARDVIKIFESIIFCGNMFRNFRIIALVVGWLR